MDIAQTIREPCWPRISTDVTYTQTNPLIIRRTYVIFYKVRTHMTFYTFLSNDEFSTKQRQAYVQAGLPAKTRIVRTESLFRNIAIRGRRLHTLTATRSDLGFVYDKLPAFPT